MTWIKLTEKAIYLMEKDEYLDKVDLQPRGNEEFDLNIPIEWFRDTEAPGQMIVSTQTSDTEPKPAPLQTTQPIDKKLAKAQFKMSLNTSSRLIFGNLFLFDGAGNQLFSAVATSGLRGNQERDDVWSRGVGPIPPIQGLWIQTEPVFLSLIGVQGAFFPIHPYTIKRPSNGFARSDFGVHFDANVPGSAGCIVIQNQKTFNGFREVMSQGKKAGVNKIPLEIIYG